MPTQCNVLVITTNSLPPQTHVSQHAHAHPRTSHLRGTPTHPDARTHDSARRRQGGNTVLRGPDTRRARLVPLFPSTAQRQLGRGLGSRHLLCSALLCCARSGRRFSTPRRVCGCGCTTTQRDGLSRTAIDVSGPKPLEQREGEGQVSQWPRVCKGARRVWSADLSAWWFFFFFGLSFVSDGAGELECDMLHACVYSVCV
jgi:hypothetical protein